MLTSYPKTFEIIFETGRQNIRNARINFVNPKEICPKKFTHSCHPNIVYSCWKYTDVVKSSKDK